VADEATGPSDADETVGESLASVVLIGNDEDIAAICGRVDGAPTWAVVVHAPKGNRQLSTELGMRRLARHAEESGKAIAVASGSHALVSRARETRVPVARRPEDVRWDAGGKHVWRFGRLSIAAPGFGRYVQVIVIVAVAFGALGLLFTLAPSATVIAYPSTETVTRTITVSASEERTEVDLDTLAVPAQRVSGERVYTVVAATTGTAQVGVEPARAGVTIRNSTQAAVVVVAGTVVLGGPAYFPFTIDETVTVPAGGSAAATVTGSRPGAEGNVPAGVITGWNEERLRFLGLTNPQAAAGGTSEPRRAVDAQDVLSLQVLAKALATSELVKAGLAETRPHDAVFLRTAETSVRQGEPRPPVGTPGEIVTMEVTVTVTALAVLEETLEEVARRVLVDEATSGEFVPGTVSAVETGARQAEEGVIRTELIVKGELARGVTAAEIQSSLKGKSKDGARSTLEERYGIQDADIRLSGWAPRFPRFESRIEVTLAHRETRSSIAQSNDDNLPSAAATAATPPPGN